MVYYNYGNYPLDDCEVVTCPDSSDPTITSAISLIHNPLYAMSNNADIQGVVQALFNLYKSMESGHDVESKRRIVEGYVLQFEHQGKVVHPPGQVVIDST